MFWKGHTDYPALDLSVVILSAGRDLAMVQRCLRTVLVACEASTSKYEVILLDNASESGIALTVAGLFPTVMVLRFPERVGFSTGNNAGFLISRGRFIVQLNDDTEVASDAFAQLISFLDQHPAVGAVGPRLETPAGALQIGYYARRLPKLRDIAFHLFGLNGVFKNNPVAKNYYLVDEEDTTRQVEQPAGAALTYRRSALFEVGLLDEDFTYAYDDVDVCKRLADAGWQIFYLKEARVTHLGAASLPKFGPRLSRDTLNGILCYWKKHGSVAEFTVVQAMMLLALCMRLSVESLANLGSAAARRAVAKAYFDGITQVVRSFAGGHRPYRLSVCAPIEVTGEPLWEARRG